MEEFKDSIYFYKACLDIMVSALVICSFILIWSSLTP